VTSATQHEANRSNALASTGPRTSAGKAISARNARRHGLNLPALRDSALADEIAALAREIAGPDAPARRFELACRIAAAQIDLVRVRRGGMNFSPAILPRPRVSPSSIATSAVRCHGANSLFASSTRRLGIMDDGSILAKRTQRPA